ncbi:MAG TPA: hypothetical protein VL172_03850 [Kofleriaceae bacterium]|jgi:hypothetical protein|nr:hypothetical protein [Kofleriaceae bacterium]
MRTALLSLGIVMMLAGRAAAGDPRWPDPSVRRAAVGCWEVGQGATLTLLPFGKHSLRATARFAQTPRGGPRVMADLAAWIPAAHQLEVACRPRSQHGSFCRVVPEGAGLRVRVYALGYRRPQVGRLVEDFVATRCRR